MNALRESADAVNSALAYTCAIIENQLDDVLFWLGRTVAWLRYTIAEWIEPIYAVAVDFFQHYFGFINHNEQPPQTVVKRRFQTAVEVYKNLPRDPQGIINDYLGKRYKKISKQAELADNLLKKLEQRGSCVHDLYIPTGYSYPLLLDTLSFFPKLQSLCIYQLLDAERLEKIAKLLPPELQKLRILLRGSKEEFDLITQFRHLASLDITGILRRTTQGHFKWLSFLEKLEELSLGGELSDTILDQLKFFPKLKKLTLEYCELDWDETAVGLKSISIKKLAALRQLEFLELKGFGSVICQKDVQELAKLSPALSLQVDFIRD